jgi:pantoate--beta-alanine ligase
MVLITALSQLQSYLEYQKKDGKTLGLVPTMGALHPGHISLIERSQKDNDSTICSIFVNPTQFNNLGDLQKYPRTLEADQLLLQKAGCDAVFAPANEEIYRQPPRLRLDFGTLEQVMEGRFRPGHFNGVGLVVSKLFHMIKPNRAYFGQKDLQQFLIIRQLVNDLSFDLQLVRCPIIREPDGLAMSSRNRRLDPEQRQKAPQIYRALMKAKEMLLGGKSVSAAKMAVQTDFLHQTGFRLEYFEVVDEETLQPVENTREHPQIALCMAAYLGEVRLIDNLLLFS